MYELRSCTNFGRGKAQVGASIAIDADSPATVGSLFASEKAAANAIMLGVNLPNFVAAALWLPQLPQAL